ncbi:hypothetical protein CsSME_00046723 [Camellia sinensis var. sinensis]
MALIPLIQHPCIVEFKEACVEKENTNDLPPAIDDVIHLIRLGSFRVGIDQPVIETVMGMDVGKLIHPARDESLANSLTLKSSTCSEIMSLNSNMVGKE